MVFNNPRQVIMVTCRCEIEILGKRIVKDNIITIAWHMPTSFQPNLYAISVGKTRFSYKLINNSNVFVVNFIPYELKDAAIFCGTYSGAHIDKFEKTGLTKEEAIKIDCPRIKEAIGYLECEIINKFDSGDHTIFLGKVVYSEFKKEKRRLFQKDEGFTTTVA